MLWLLIVIPFVDVVAAVVLVRAARIRPRVQLLYDRARAAVIGTIAAELVAILALLFLQGRSLDEPWGSLLLFSALVLPGLIAPMFLLDYWRGLYGRDEG